MGNPRSKVGIESRKAWNESLRCKTRGCLNTRQGFNSTCGPCTSRKYTLGAASAKPLPRAAYGNEWATVKKFCKRFRAHPRIVQGIASLHRWMSDAQMGKAVPGRDAVAKLADKGAVHAPEIVLIEILAVALHASTHDNPATRAPFLYASAMLHGIKGMPRGPHATSRKRLGAAPLSKYFSYRDRKAMQQEITLLLGETMAEMIAYFERAEALRNAEIAAKAKEGPNRFPTLCSRCSYNETKRLEKQRAKVKAGWKPRVYPPGGFNPTGINGRTKKREESADGETETK